MGRCRTISLLGVAIFSLGCSSAPPVLAPVSADVSPNEPGGPTAVREGSQPFRLEIVRRFGTPHGPLVVRRGIWYQGRGTRIVLINSETLEERDAVDLKGRVTDLRGLGDHLADRLDGHLGNHLANHSGSQLVALVAGRGVVYLAADTNAGLRVLGESTEESLGLTPVSLSVVGNVLYVCGVDPSGAGAVVRVHDQAVQFQSEPEIPSSIIGIGMGIEMGGETENPLAVIVGRQIRRIEDDRFLGSASQLIPIPPGHSMELPALGMDSARYIFLRRGTSTTVGLMGESLREIHRHRLTVKLPEPARKIMLVRDRIWVIGEQSLWAYALIGGQLHLTDRVDFPGATGLAELDGERLVLANPTTRAVYQWRGTREMQQVRHVPAQLTASGPSGRSVLASGAGLHWRFNPARGEIRLEPGELGGAGEPGELGLSALPPRRQDRAVTIWGAATIANDRSTLQSASWNWSESTGAALHTLVAVNGEMWVGHDRGITVLGPSATGVRELAALDLGGRVEALYPLLDGSGAVFVGDKLGIGQVRRVATE